MGRGDSDQILFGEAVIASRPLADGGSFVPLAVKEGDIHWLADHLLDELPAIRHLRYPEPGMLVVGGMPGAGKTTMLERIDPQAEVLSIDEIVEELSRNLGRTADKDLNARANEVMLLRAGEHFKEERPVIIDAPALVPSIRSLYQKFAARFGVPCNALMIYAEVDTASRARAATGRPLDDKVMRQYAHMWEKFDNELADNEDRQGFDSVVVADSDTSRALKTISFDS